MQVALGLGSLVLLAGGLAAVVRRTMTPVQAGSVLLIAAVVVFVVQVFPLLPVDGAPPGE